MLEKALFITKLFLDGWEKLLSEDVLVQQAPGQSPKVDSAAGSGHHQYRACSGMAAGRCECICTHSEAKTFGGWPGVKKGSKEATSLQEKHQGQTDILQKVQGLDR